MDRDGKAREKDALRELRELKDKKQGVTQLDPREAFEDMEAGSEMSTDHRARPLWLLKVPIDVARAWQKASSMSTSLGSLRMVPAGGSSASASASAASSSSAPRARAGGKPYCVVDLDAASTSAAGGMDQEELD